MNVFMAWVKKENYMYRMFKSGKIQMRKALAPYLFMTFNFDLFFVPV